ncbi:MAG: hypothetical protein M0C28_26120 [Candidatus Moduliflexus flocculans]|nr:hypothetical protein [Candidatus Moduliflexus flocculans]
MLHSVTITSVKVSDDLRNAKIYFVEMGKDECSDGNQGRLDSSGRFYPPGTGQKVAAALVYRNLLFIHDQSFGYGNRIEKLLAEIAKQEKKMINEIIEAINEGQKLFNYRAYKTGWRRFGLGTGLLPYAERDGKKCGCL